MTAGYDPSNPVASDHPGDDPDRLGPLPPRVSSTGQFPATGSLPAQPTSAWPVSAPTHSVSPHSAPPLSGPPVPLHAAPRRSPLGAIALVLAVVLLLVAGVQTVFLVQQQRRIDTLEAAAKTDRETDASRLKAVEGRADALEQKTGGNLNAAEIAQTVGPSVFRVATKYATGTGFALGKAPSGGGTDLITNYHVVADAYQRGEKDVSLERTDQRFPGKIVEVHPEKDLAVLHTDEEFPRLAPASAVPKVGETVLAIGSPLGLEATVTTGVVSAFRTLQGEQLMQFDAAINPGNSGGPVFNAKKEVVGVTTLKASQAEGIAFAIPISVVCDTIPAAC
jgi:putative serine protease PepD